MERSAKFAVISALILCSGIQVQAHGDDSDTSW